MDPVERFLCLASYEKGHDFVRQCAEMSVKVTVLTLDKHRDGAWPHESLEELVSMPAGLNREQILNTVSWMARSKRFDRVIALHEFDLETAAQIREHMRVPGMGATTAGCYRDKLAQRVIAGAFGYHVPEFCRVLNYDEIRDYVARVPGPWLLKPRTNTAIAGGRKIENADQLWRALEELGDAQSRFILEKVVHGDTFHVDSIVSGGEVRFAVVSRSKVRPLQPPRTDEIFTTCMVDRDSRDAKQLIAINRDLAPSLGMARGVTHARFLRSRADGSHYFLEIGARVGGAYVDQVVEAATGVNLWREWAKLEVGELRGTPYAGPDARDGYAGAVVCTWRFTEPDVDAVADPEIAARIRGDHESGLIVQARDAARVQTLVDNYAARFEGEMAASDAARPIF
jgi:biotin carboxylase